MQVSRRRRLFALAVSLSWPMALSGAAWSPSRAAELPSLRSDRPPMFAADLSISVDSAGHPALSVTVTVPYSELQWVKVQGGYGAGAEFTVVLEPRGKARQLGDVWERRVAVRGFDATTSLAAVLVERRSFDTPPGHYGIRVGVTDVDAGETSSAQQQLEVPDYSRVPVGFADLELGTVGSSSTFLAVPARRFGMEAAHLAGRVTFFDRRTGSWPRSYAFQYRILDESGSEVTAGKRELSLTRSGEPVLVRPDSAGLFIGAYVFQVELVEGRSRWRIDRSFEVEESGPPRGRDFERILEPLSLIAEPGEIEHLRSLPPDQQPLGWEEFWRRRDPSPDTPRNEALLEFFHRLRYAEQHFQNFGPGWRSDMGRIYIKYGPPDQIENHPPTPQAPQLEIWYYNRPYRRYVFADRDGFGRYVLVSSGQE